ncbi:sine oculis-binding protein homolog isoform X2 [Osmerus eperlanus]|uniref:sine oculis-binding protein homolog isoform X2 n=1 Tax=Osmerus eperlanus TaxID=29151 RepID=UPI002E163C44
MPEMEKVRPPENKRSRKPAHPVKREINQEMKTFAESTMNELLGWYGYDKVELRDSEASEIRSYPNRDRRQHVSVLKENSVPKLKSFNNKTSPSALAMRSGERESPSVPSSSSPSSSMTSPKEHKSAPVIVPLIKPSAVDDVQNVQIVCVWCQKEGVKRYSLCMGSELKSFCSEKCFAACRRAYFKRNKARDEDLHGERSPQHPPHPEDSPRLVLKNSSARVCDWCKHVRHTKEYLDFGAGQERLQFCSTKCLNQYKMDVFYREARAALTSSSPARPPTEGKPEGGAQQLLTPESWNSGGGDTRQRTLSPKGPTPIHGTAASASMSPSEASSSKVPLPGPRPPERPPQPPPPPPAPEMMSQPVHPPRPHMEHHPAQPLPQIPLSFIRPPLHAQGLKSPISNPPRHSGPPSSPIHRPPHSPHLQPPIASSMNPPSLVHPYPGAYFPGLHSPPINIIPHGHVPMHPMMNFSIPTFGPLLPQPTVLVPYPIIVPLPVPIPIPIPIPIPVRSKAGPEAPGHNGVIQPVPEGAERASSMGVRQPYLGIPSGENRQVFNRVGRTNNQRLPSPSGLPWWDTDWVKSERQHPASTCTPHSRESSPSTRYNISPCSGPGPEGMTDLQPVHQSLQQPERQVIQRVLQRTQVKQEPNIQGVVDLSGPGEPKTRKSTRAGLYDSTRSPQFPSHDTPNHPNTNSPPGPHGEGSPCDGDSPTPCTLSRPDPEISPPDPPSLDTHPQRAVLPTDPTLNELEAVKENSFSGTVSQVRAESTAGYSEEIVACREGDDPHVPDEDHAYALPTAPRTGDTPTTLLLPKLRDKGALRNLASVASMGPGDLEPALKRRCLRIRDQNK